jgi:hypothetical protein
MRNELLRWAEEQSNESLDCIKFADGYHYVLSALIDKINPIPVPSVEGYLEGNVINVFAHTPKELGNGYYVKESDALTALRALKEDCEDRCRMRWEAEIGKAKLDALPELAELKAEVERLRNGWISVDDAEPKESETVLVIGVKQSELSQDQYEPSIGLVMWGHKEWSECVDTCHYGVWYTKISHWQSLPNPPKQ